MQPRHASYCGYGLEPVDLAARRVESRMGAGTGAERRPVSHPRSSNRTCRFPASGFPTGFIVDSRICHPGREAAPMPGDQIQHPRSLTSTLRRHRVTHLRLAIQLALKGPGETSVLVDSSSITSPFLLHKHTRSKGPSLHRHYPASSVLYDPLRLPDDPWTFPSAFEAATLDHPESPPLKRLPSWHAVLTTPVARSVLRLWMPLSRHSAFAPIIPDRFRLPRLSAGSAPHFTFRGLLKLYSHYGLPSCSPTFPWTFSRGFDTHGFPSAPLVSY